MLLPLHSTPGLFKKQPSSELEITERETQYGFGTQRRESLLMSREMHSFGLDPSVLEGSQSMMPTICLHWKEEGAHYQLASTLSNSIRG
jgi:hypothetical protein